MKMGLLASFGDLAVNRHQEVRRQGDCGHTGVPVVTASSAAVSRRADGGAPPCRIVHASRIASSISRLHIFIDFGQLCSSKPTTHVHGNRTAVFMISTTCFQAGQHTFKAS